MCILFVECFLPVCLAGSQCCSTIVSLLILFLIVLSIIESGVLKSPTITVEFSIYAFNYVSFSFMYFGGLFWVRFTCIYILGLPRGLTLLPL